MQAAGLGMVPGDTRINGAVQSVSSTSNNKVTTMFWRGAENFDVEPDANPMLWAVSQAAPYRRMHVAGNINFDKGGWASGSEIPYDPPSVEQWNDNGRSGFASYKVADSVQVHRAWGLGIEIRHIVNFAGLNGGINHVRSSE